MAAWDAMLPKLPADSPWRGAVEEAIDEARSRMAAASGGQPSPGPDQQQIDNAASMSDADRTAMIETMVAGLDEKLRQNPRDPEGWTRLVRSYLVLGKTEAARDAARARRQGIGRRQRRCKTTGRFCRVARSCGRRSSGMTRKQKRLSVIAGGLVSWPLRPA